MPATITRSQAIAQNNRLKLNLKKVFRYFTKTCSIKNIQRDPTGAFIHNVIALGISAAKSRPVSLIKNLPQAYRY